MQARRLLSELSDRRATACLRILPFVLTCTNLLTQFAFAGQTVVPAEGSGASAATMCAFRTPGWLAAPSGEPLLAHHTPVRCMNAAPGNHTRISAFPCRWREGVMVTSHRNTDYRAGARQTLTQLLPTSGDDARRSSMHAPAPSRCVLHGTDGRRPGRGNPDQFDTCTKALRLKQLPVFRLEQPGKHPRSVRAELRHGLLLRREVQILRDNRLASVPCPTHRLGQCIR